MRTFNRETFVHAASAWNEGRFDEAWEPCRRAAAEAGFIFPPTGDRHDTYDGGNSSQRAIVWHHIENNPGRLLAIIGRSSSWSDVVARLIGLEQRMVAEAEAAEPSAEEVSLRKYQARRADAVALRNVIQRLAAR